MSRNRTAAGVAAVLVLTAGCGTPRSTPVSASAPGVVTVTATASTPTAITGAITASASVSVSVSSSDPGGPSATTVTPPTGSADSPTGSPSATPTGSAPSPPPPSTTPAPSGSPPSSPAPTGPGADPFAGRRVVAYYGAAGTAGLGILGAGSPAQEWTALDRQAIGFDAPGRSAVHCFELITTIAADSPGADGDYRNRVAPAVIAPYLDTVRAHHGVLLLDVQPGRSDFLTEAKALTPLLDQPDVGLALDPEWRMGPGQVPGKVIGSVTATEVNAVSGWLDALTAAHHLPDKLFVVHQFTDPEITDEPDLLTRAHLHAILNVDGFGAVGLKKTVYTQLAAHSPYPLGLKLFYRQDPVLMTPTQVDALTPAPQLIDYQ